MVGKDPFAPWRGASEFTIEEAAHLCAGVVPGRKFRLLKDRDKEEQEDSAAVDGWKRCLVDAAESLCISK